MATVLVAIIGVLLATIAPGVVIVIVDIALHCLVK